jgi:hypothetical protein
LVVNATEKQGLVTNGELIEALERGAHDDVTLNEVTGATHIGDSSGVAQLVRFVAHVFKRAEGRRQERLLFGNLAIMGHDNLWG